MRTYLNAERDLYDVPESQRFIVRYDDLLNRIPETVRNIYRHFDLPGPDENLSKVLEEFETKEKHVSQHKYELEEFGIDPKELRAKLSPVFENHPIPA